ncbi:MAG: CoA pyrophosphatase [Betaproteobacteria bacterium]|nr:CoA pyrophosphatase [Betaproteobacteria bacterium]
MHKSRQPYPITREQLAQWLQNNPLPPENSHSGVDSSRQTQASSASSIASLTPAAVLIPIINHQNGLHILFTQRTDQLTHHAGQISFPGGRVEPSDRDITHTALRESMEETGLPADRVTVLGTLPQHITGTGYLVTPVVGWIDPPISYQPDPAEVAECFEVPFHFLIDPANHRQETAMYKGQLRSYCAIPYEHRYIWGATAGIIVTLTRLIIQAVDMDKQSH